MKSNVCRICIGEEFLSSIFEKRGLECISTQIMSLANINILPNDGLPNKICSTCIKKLDDCTNFIHLCQDSENKLKRTLYAKNSDEDSPTGLEIDFQNENYSLGIEDENFTECNLITEPNSHQQAFSTIPDNTREIKSIDNIENSKIRKRKISFKEGNHLNDKKKSVKQQCFTCGKVMSSRFRLKTHLRTHTGERPYSCTLCNKTFSLQQNLKVHMRIHTGEKPLQCPICNESFAQTAGLAAHKRKHTGQTPYHCLLCPRSFRTNGHLQYHVRRHTGEKNFECDTCNKAFITRSGLKQHLLTHSGVRPHVCAVCGKRMQRASHVERHIQRVHQGLFTCSKCPAKFQEKNDFQRHVETHECEKK